MKGAGGKVGRMVAFRYSARILAATEAGTGELPTRVAATRPLFVTGLACQIHCGAGAH